MILKSMQFTTAYLSTNEIGVFLKEYDKDRKLFYKIIPLHEVWITDPDC